MLTTKIISRFFGKTFTPRHTQLFIDGKYVNAVSGKTITSVNPSTEEVLGEFQCAGPEDVNLAVNAARNAFDHGPWPRMSGYERGLIMQKIADEIEKRHEELAHLETMDNGKPVKFSKFADIPLSVQHFRYFAGWCDKIEGSTLSHNTTFGHHVAHTLVEPIGVAAQIIPWNFPMLMASWKMAPALATGCTLVLKPSEKTPITNCIWGEIMNAAGLPPGVVNVIGGYGDAGQCLTKHAGVDKIAFTGSTSTALKVKADIGLKPFTAELGGKSPMIVFEDADIDKAVETSHKGLFFNKGECCNASSRVFVHDKIFDEFLRKSVEMAKTRKVGNPMEDVDQGAQVDKLQFDKIMGYINTAKKDGVKIATGGNRVGDKGYFIEPTIMVDINEDHVCCKEEIFGPVMIINRFTDEADVVRRANNSNFGLAAGIFSENVHTVNRVSRLLKAGTIFVNSYHVFDNSTPFGGYKDSGMGREKGKYALQNYLQTKAVIQPLMAENAEALGWYR